MSDDSGKDQGAATRAVQTVISAVRVQDSELKRWRRTFDSNAKIAENGEKYVLNPYLVCMLLTNVQVSQPRAVCERRCAFRGSLPHRPRSVCAAFPRCRLKQEGCDFLG